MEIYYSILAFIVTFDGVADILCGAEVRDVSKKSGNIDFTVAFFSLIELFWVAKTNPIFESMIAGLLTACTVFTMINAHHYH